MQKRIALLYDFDYTLAKGFMQQFGLMQELGYDDVREFFKACENAFDNKDAYSIINGVVDGASFFEISKDSAKDMVTGFIKLNGMTVGAVANRSEVYDEEGKVSFKNVRNPQIVITNEETGEELCAYNLKENFSSETAVVTGALVLNDDGEWEFEAIGKGYDGGLQTLVDMYS